MENLIINNYLLSIDPSIKNTGFTLWENKKPIWVNSYSFKKFNNDEWEEFKHAIYKEHNWETKLIIERGIFNSKYGKGKETLDNLRGWIAGQFNKLITKNMLISPSEWQNWYKKQFNFNINIKWDKVLSINCSKRIIEENNWNIKVNNHDEADSLLIGWYYLNKEVK